MLPIANISREEMKEIRDDLLWYIRAILFGSDRKKAFQLTLKVCGYATAISIVVGLLVALGQVLAIGYDFALSTYLTWWLLIPLGGIAAVIALFIIAFIFFVAFGHIGDMLKKMLSEGVIRWFTKSGDIIVLVIAIGMFVWMIIYTAFDIAKTSNEMLTSPTTGNIDDMSKAVVEQGKSLQSLSKGASKLLEELESSELQFQRAKRELSKAISTIDQQLGAVDSANRKVESLSLKKRQIELRVDELQKILEGQTPITRQDLEASGRLGLMYGGVLGFLASIAATIVVNKLSRRGRRRNKH